MTQEQISIGQRDFVKFIDEQQISESVHRVANQINIDYNDKNPLFICVLNGAFMFASDLMKQIKIPSEITFIRVSSYEGTNSTGDVKEIVGLIEPVANRHIIIIEDIVDTGLTINRLWKQLTALNVSSIAVTTMLQKPDALEYDIEVKYPSIKIPNAFVIGYGLDLDGQARNLPEIYQIKD
jgi:hypoxanthine phosphoribosyltransferase